MSVLDEIKKLDEQKAKLLAQAKREALAKAEAAVKELNELGFDYQLVERGKPTTTRRTGIRQTILDEIAKHPNGIGRQQLMDTLDMSDSKGRQALSNAIAALKKQGKIVGDDGHYTAK